MSNYDELIESLKHRAVDPKTRTDHAGFAVPPLFPPATQEMVAMAEEGLGFRLPELLARVCCEVANGGFGPGDGLIGLPGGYQEDGCSVLDLYRELKPGVSTEWNWPERMLPIVDWGCAMFSCVDCKSADSRIAMSEEAILSQTAYDLRGWLEEWCHGERLWDKMFEACDWEEKSIINPFTGKPATIKRRVRRPSEGR
jgi:hypothetical protein